MMPLQQSDSLARLMADTLSVRPDTLGAPPLPGGVAAVVRAMFGAPTWMWLVAGTIAAAAGAVLLRTLWKRRASIKAWVVSRPRGVRIALFAGVAVLALCAAGFGAVTWNYTQHDNDFCASCHVMSPAFQAMQTSTVHDSLNCHSCHQQSVFASAWQLYVWLKDRPEKIDKHADVPRATCSECHSGENEKWQRVARTAGHRVHLESDSSALDSVTCTTCHSEEIHRFVPADRTCGQSGCHRQEDTRIVIGPMASQTTLHCVTCHQYTEELPQLAALDSARGALRPGRAECFSCHEMRVRLAEFNLARDPHGGQCGMCHNPHTQTRPEEAIKSCATAACHGDWRDIPFHTGRNHRNSAASCETCHTPHAARVDASDCQGCHADVARRVPRLRNLPQGFDTTRALRGAFQPHETPAPQPVALPPVALQKEGGKPPMIAADTFEHGRHRALACLTCHPARGSARLTFEAPRGCQICHHQAPAQSRCATCHADTELTQPHAEQLTVSVRNQAPRQRAVGFRHDAHPRLTCTDCHTAPVSLAAADTVTTCAACHDDHHAAGRSCIGCHTERATDPPHAPPAEAHAACDACHQVATVALLVPDRALCLNCHDAQREHLPGQECTTCHFLQEPAAYRRHLRAG